MKYEELEHLLLELGPSTGFIDGLTQMEPGEWVASCSGEIEIHIYCADDVTKLTFTTDLGEVTSGNRRNVYLALLAMNAHSRELGGVQFGMEEETAQLIQEVFLQDFTLMRFQACLAYFLDRASQGVGVVEELNADFKDSGEVAEGMVFV